MRQCRVLGSVVAILIIASALRFYQIGAQEIWVDEALSFQLVSSPQWKAFAVRESSPPLYYLLLRPWTLFAGTSEAGLRSFSAFCGVLFVAAMIWAGWIMFTPAVGLWSGAFAALAPIHIYYSQEARTYTLLLLWLVLTYATLGRALQKGTWRAWLLVAVCAVLALYSHYFSILALIPTALLVHVWPAPDVRHKWMRYASATFLCLLLFSPWVLLNFVAIAHPTAQHSWIVEFWEKTPPLLAIPKSLEALGLGTHLGVGGSYMKQFTWMVFPQPIRYLGIGMLALVALVALLPWGDRQLAIPWLSKRKRWLVTTVLFPLLVLWVVSLVYKPYYLVGRYDMVVFPAYALLVGLGLAKLQALPRAGSIVAPLAALLLLVPLTTKLVLYYTAPPASMWQPARVIASFLDELVDNGDAVAFGSLRGMPVLYYLEARGYQWSNGRCENPRTGRHFLCWIYPSQIHELLFDFDHPERVTYSEDVVRSDLRDMIAQPGFSTNAVWVVLETPVHETLLDELQRLGFSYYPEKVLKDLAIVVFRRS